MSNQVTKKREEIDQQYKWNLEKVYPDENIWEDDFKRTRLLTEEVVKTQGSLGQSSVSLLRTLQLSDEIERLAQKLYVYAKMRRDENNANSRYQGLFDRAESLSVQVSSAMAFVVPEILEIAPEQIETYLNENQDLVVYKHFLDELFRQKAHILSPVEERLLAMSADLSLAAGNAFGMLNNADIRFPVITDEEGQEVELTKGRYGSLMESSDRRVRKDAFEGMYSSYGKLINTLGSTMNSNIKSDIFYANVRNYESALQASLDQDNVSVEVYDHLIESVHANMDHMYRYMKIRKKMLGLDELHMYDIYTPLVAEYKMKVPYEDAKSMVVKALRPLGKEYVAKLEEGMNAGWIDVYENEGKTSGAYSWGTYDTNPYVLLNYDNKLDDAFTVAHEMGHSLHSYYSNQSQAFVNSQYPIFVAEVASTVNESLLIDYLLQNSSSKEEKIYLINHYLEQFRGTVYRQTMFAEFEKITHEKAEQGEALTPEALNEIYYELNRLYYGPDVVLDDEIKLEWARIPHFYTAFYVYKYATGFSTATALKQQILEEGSPAVERYLNFLKSGCSDYPIHLLQKAGVDLTTPEPVDQALNYFGKLLDELESLIG